MNKKDIKFRYTKGKGPGGQNKNKLETCVHATHIPTGLTVTVDGRKRGQNKKKAVKLLEGKVAEAKAADVAKKRKDAWHEKLKDKKPIRTYNFKEKKAKDNRSGKSVDLDDLLNGKIDLKWLSTRDDYYG